eukprot:tig00020780_g13781.t1
MEAFLCPVVPPAAVQAPELDRVQASSSQAPRRSIAGHVVQDMARSREFFAGSASRSRLEAQRTFEAAWASVDAHPSPVCMARAKPQGGKAADPVPAVQSEEELVQVSEEEDEGEDELAPAWGEDMDFAEFEDLAARAEVAEEPIEEPKPDKKKASSKLVYKPHRGLPVVAVLGRPNVGKSTIVNRLAGNKDSIVHDTPGVTRDRTYRESFWNGREFIVVDTGGLVFNDQEDFMPLIREQAMAALAEASAAILVVDGQVGPSSRDKDIATMLQKYMNKIPVYLAVNKCESPTQGQLQAAEFWSMGLGEPFPVSGLHGNGLAEILDDLVPRLPPGPSQEELEAASKEIRVAIVGRPNVGKSSLLNSFVGEGRAIVSPISGTTRDAIDTVVTRQGQVYRLIDTAGIRRRTKVSFGPEYFGINRAMKAIRRCDVALFVMDATEGVTDQDQKLARMVSDEGRACVIVANKWDAVQEKDGNTIYEFEKSIRSYITDLEWAPMIFTSALTGQRVPGILDLVDRVVAQHRRRVPTGVVNEVINDVTAWHAPPTNPRGQQGRIYYGTQVRAEPPSMVLFVNDPKLFNNNYQRYFNRQFRKNLGFEGTPIKFFMRPKRRSDPGMKKVEGVAKREGRPNPPQAEPRQPK